MTLVLFDQFVVFCVFLDLALETDYLALEPTDDLLAFLGNPALGERYLGRKVGALRLINKYKTARQLIETSIRPGPC